MSKTQQGNLTNKNWVYDGRSEWEKDTNEREETEKEKDKLNTPDDTE